MAKNKKSKKSTYSIFIIIAVALVVCICYYFNIPPMNFDLGIGFKAPISEKPPIKHVDGEMYISFIDVGQGDCILIEFADNKNMLIDGGDYDKSDNKVAEKILDYLKARNVSILDYVLLTHTDADHCGSLDKVIQSDDILAKTVYMPYVRSKYEKDPIVNGTSVVSDQLKNAVDMTTKLESNTRGYIETKNYADFVQAVVNEKSKIIYSVKGEKIEGTGYSFIFVTPNAEFYNEVKKDNSEGINNVSPINMLEFNGVKVIFTGDAHTTGGKNKKGAEEAFLYNIKNDANLRIDPDCDVLKVGHHGSRSSSSSAFLNAIKPEVAVISAGKNNKYSHPHTETLSALNRIGAKIYCTIDFGTTLLTINKNGYSLSTEKLVSNNYKIIDCFAYSFGMN
ncbi:MAG: MBL fold metallo-hydrolase [Clostridia bacterium]